MRFRGEDVPGGSEPDRVGPGGFGLGVLTKKVVPDHSSLIGDSQEYAETIQVNHTEGDVSLWRQARSE